MPSHEEQELEQLIDQLADASRNGLVPWKSVNPTTFVFDRVVGQTIARITLQYVERQIVSVKGISQAASYVFQAVEVRGGQTYQKLSITSTTQPYLSQKLQGLFQLVSTGLSRQGLDFLKKIIPESGS